jgi:UDP-sugar diphosphatase
MAGPSPPPPADPALYPHGLVSLTAASHPACTAAAILRRLGPSPPTPGPLPPSGSAFVRPLSLSYSLDGTRKRWDMVRSHASVGVLLYHSDLKAAIVVRQFRPAVYESVRGEGAEAEKVKGGGGGAGAADTHNPHSNPPLSAGFTFELCAGILDKAGLSTRQVAAEEVAEECGFRVDPGALEEVGAYRTAIGITGAAHTVFYAAVSDADRLEPGEGAGGGVDGEAIETLALPVDRIDAFLADPALARSAGLMFALVWLKDRVRAGRA